MHPENYYIYHILKKNNVIKLKLCRLLTFYSTLMKIGALKLEREKGF